jgi:anti-sigma B factor antagonist
LSGAGTARGRVIVSEIWTYAVTRAGDDVTVVLSGELDISAKDTIEAVLIAEIERVETSTVHVDLSGVSFLDSTAMSALVRAYLTAQEQHCGFAVTGAIGIVRRSLQTTGLLALLSD